ncbi:MAG: CBS domain-containing protein [Spirochaetia bacterium]
MTGIPINTVDSPSVILELIYKLKIKDVMSTDIYTAARKEPIRSIQKLMKANGITGVPIAEDKRLYGIVSMDDIIRALDTGSIDAPAEDLMSRNLIVLEDDMPLSFAISYFDKYQYGRFPVLSKEKQLVGIITSRDIITALLVEINKEMQKLEKQMQKDQPGPVGRMVKEFTTNKFDFENAGKASTEVKKTLKKLKTPSKIMRRIAVAMYELEMNQVVHSEGGKIRFTLDTDRVEIRAQDRGPGIPDVEQALTEGFSTANEWIRSLGFGAGMGLPNVKRVSDEFSICSSEEGTKVECTIYLKTGDTNEDTKDC